MPWKLVSCIIGIPTVGYKSTLLQYPNKSCSTILHRHSSQVWHKHVSPGGWLIKGVIHVATITSVPCSIVETRVYFSGQKWWVSLFNLTNLGWFCGAQFEPHRLSPELHRKCLGQTLSSPEAAVERLSKGPSERGGFFKLRRIPWNTPRNTIQPSYCDMGTLCQCSISNAPRVNIT